MSNLLVYKDTGELLFDTNLISYGLIKSGYMVYLESWIRREYLNNNQDPNNGANWSPVQVKYDPTYTDTLHGFTVWGWISPICFITGPGCLNGTRINGDGSMTFLYSNAGTSTKFFCFDLMADNLGGSTFLKTWDTTGRITFNSLQPPLNVVAAYQAPGPGSVDQFGRYKETYAGGYTQSEPELGPASPWRRKRATSRVDIGLSAVEYAVYLPWSRSVIFNDFNDFNGFFNASQYGGQEGAYGRFGGISFLFGASAGTTSGGLNTSGYSAGISFSNLPTDRYPVALIIHTDNLIFPYN
jgi:hypothetical protein